VVSEIAKYLDDPMATVRRSAIFILWKGGFDSIAPAEEKLLALCKYEENFTRGMAALALGSAKASSSFETLKDMTLHDKDGYVRRCAAYALGLYGDKKAIGVLEKALQDQDPLVKNNAQAAITMLTKLNTESAKTNKLEAENLTAEGWKLWQERKLAEAEEKFKAAIELDALAENAYQGLGWAQLNQGKKLNAKQSFEKCIELNPKNSAALNGLGWIAQGQGNTDEAIKWWEKAVEASNGTATASLSGLAQVYMEKGDYKNAIKYYQMWLKAEPDNKQAQDGLKKAKASQK
jgi:tetratricopeptide (TPR) repeat protein